MGPRKLFLVFLLGSGVIFGYGSAILSLAHGGGAACHHSPPPPVDALTPAFPAG